VAKTGSIIQHLKNSAKGDFYAAAGTIKNARQK
jgi:hypothetical protein